MCRLELLRAWQAPKRIFSVLLTLALSVAAVRRIHGQRGRTTTIPERSDPSVATVLDQQKEQVPSKASVWSCGGALRILSLLRPLLTPRDITNLRSCPQARIPFV